MSGTVEALNIAAFCWTQYQYECIYNGCACCESRHSIGIMYDVYAPPSTEKLKRTVLQQTNQRCVNWKKCISVGLMQPEQGT